MATFLLFLNSILSILHILFFFASLMKDQSQILSVLSVVKKNHKVDSVFNTKNGYIILYMQYFALENATPILASEAKKGAIYYCPECQSSLRLRSGPHRQPHFYHVARQSECRQHQKSLTHLQIQKIVSSLLPPKEALLEKSFPQIKRIADVAWENKKIIYEIQCSPISLEEAQSRCRDYHSLGFLPVWILHDKRFNRKKLSAAEHFLRTQHCYFTNINEKGEGLIYNQQDVCQGHRRISKGCKIPVDLQNPTTLPKKETAQKMHRKFSFSRLYKTILYLLLETV